MNKKPITSAILLLALIISPFIQASAASSDFGTPTYSEGAGEIRLYVRGGYSGTVHYTLISGSAGPSGGRSPGSLSGSGSEVVDSGSAQASGGMVAFPIRGGLPRAKYTLVVWKEDADGAAGSMSSFEMTFGTGTVDIGMKQGFGETGYLTPGTPGINNGDALVSVKTPTALVYRYPDMKDPIRELKRYDRVIWTGMGSDADSEIYYVVGYVFDENTEVRQLLEDDFVLPSSDYASTNPANRQGGAPVVNTARDIDYSKYQYIEGLKAFAGYMYASTLRPQYTSAGEEFYRRATNIALSRLGSNGLYNQSWRFAPNYADCSSFVWWAMKEAGVRIPGGTTVSVMMETLRDKGGDAVVYDLADAVVMFAPEFQEHILDDSVVGVDDITNGDDFERDATGKDRGPGGIYENLRDPNKKQYEDSDILVALKDNKPYGVIVVGDFFTMSPNNYNWPDYSAKHEIISEYVPDTWYVYKDEPGKVTGFYFKERGYDLLDDITYRDDEDNEGAWFSEDDMFHGLPFGLYKSYIANVFGVDKNKAKGDIADRQPGDVIVDFNHTPMNMYFTFPYRYDIKQTVSYVLMEKCTPNDMGIHSCTGRDTCYRCVESDVIEREYFCTAEASVEAEISGVFLYNPLNNGYNVYGVTHIGMYVGEGSTIDHNGEKLTGDYIHCTSGDRNAHYDRKGVRLENYDFANEKKNRSGYASRVFFIGRPGVVEEWKIR